MPTAILDEKNIAISEGNITVYNYKPSTGEYIGSENEYLLVGLGIPGNSTIPPLLLKKRGRQLYGMEWNGIILRIIGEKPFIMQAVMKLP